MAAFSLGQFFSLDQPPQSAREIRVAKDFANLRRPVVFEIKPRAGGIFVQFPIGRRRQKRPRV
jgi:hypothetical protein